MANVGQSFLGGIQSGKAAGLGELQTIEGVRSIVAQRDKAERIKGLLGEHGEAAPAQQFGIEGQLYGEDPALASGLRTFRTEGQKEQSANLARLAVTSESALGTPEEPQMMLHLGMVAGQYGVSDAEIQPILTEYSQLVSSDPAKATEFATGVLDEIATKGMDPEDVLKSRSDLKTALAKEARTLKTTVAEEERGEATDVRLAGIKQKNALELERLKQTGKAPSARDQKITDNMRLYNLNEADATAVADGLMKVQTDPLSGQPSLVNVATGIATPITETVPDVPTPPVVTDPGIDPTVPQQTLMESVRDAYGAVPAIKEGISKTFGQIFEGANFPETTKARTQARVMEKNLLNALALSGRPPVFEQQRILDLLPELGVLESPERAETIFTEIHGALSRQILDDAAVENDPSIAKKTRTEAQSRRIAIESVLRELGAPETTGDMPTVTTQEEWNALEAGTQYIDESGNTATKGGG